jgi:dTDP-4-amino-4,6-dideoxygalactose transaminase
VNSGTSALWISYHLAGIKNGTLVISTPMTCSATNIPLIHLGAKIIWADIDLNTGNIDPLDVENKIKKFKKVKAVVIVDYGGMPCDMERFNYLSKKYNVLIIEDAAQALGAEYNGFKIGNHNKFVCFSFQAVKTITTVDGGAICLSNKKDYERARRLRWFGIDREKKYKKKKLWQYNIKEAGYKMHLNDVLATIGIEQLKWLDRLVSKQRKGAEYYNNNLKGMKEISLLQEPSNCKGSFWLYPILVKHRDKFIKILKQYGVECSPVHQRNDKLSIFGTIDRSLKNVEIFDKKAVCLPNGYWVTDEDREFIIHIIKKYFD